MYIDIYGNEKKQMAEILIDCRHRAKCLKRPANITEQKKAQQEIEFARLESHACTKAKKDKKTKKAKRWLTVCALKPHWHPQKKGCEK